MNQSDQVTRTTSSPASDDLPSHLPTIEPDRSCRGLLDDIEISIRYHGRREAYFTRGHLLSQVIALLGSSAAVVVLLGPEGAGLAKYFAAFVALITTIDLVRNLAGMARLHRGLRERYTSLKREVLREDAQLAGQWPHAKVAEFDAQIRLIDQDEPPVFKAVEAQVRNEQIIAESRVGSDHVAKYLLPVGWWEALTANLIRHDNIGARMHARAVKQRSKSRPT